MKISMKRAARVSSANRYAACVTDGKGAWQDRYCFVEGKFACGMARSGRLTICDVEIPIHAYGFPYKTR